MKEVFACFDKDSSGSVTTAELGLVLKSMNKNYNDAELKRIVGKFDANGDGQIDFDEFLQMMTRHDKKEVDELKQAFEVFDKASQHTHTHTSSGTPLLPRCALTLLPPLASCPRPCCRHRLCRTETGRSRARSWRS